MILVTGATGTVGRHVVQGLLDAGHAVRATTRDPASAGLPAGVDVVRAEPDTYPLAGVSAVFLNPAALPHGPATLLTRAAAHGVRRVVLLSSSSVLCEENPIGAHHLALEQQVRSTGLQWTLLRAGVFAANALEWADQIRAEGVVRAAYGQASHAPIDERDIAAVAVRALCDDSDALVNAAPLLTGPEPLTQADQARLIGDVLGRPVRFEELPPEVARQHMLDAGVPPLVADGLLDYHANAVNHPAEISPAVATITGRPPHTFTDWVSTHRAAFE
ncbi:NAD(P)H-binding protein [Goodfellowiella coeruleoviolacea]|uniref:Uncharacterized conserved protein YbjT, contains NAD(P)-binding and DUF2867 domains n=1 Tax=Goodfellowiella coeruleoviolacea TaxID=334858 RepID=A0AAE3GHX2_9PSEU|nr:NAD(P)H-binding protein [Goodfellowiella coeruleoviolacea]MCP2166453.1 Uncharacterized conserved protein YbjT, contains NAD(P)-binding and DUF2867 domains [Goodfellowiella coeruleoviolacea]